MWCRFPKNDVLIKSQLEVDRMDVEGFSRVLMRDRYQIMPRLQGQTVIQGNFPIVQFELFRTETHFSDHDQSLKFSRNRNQNSARGFHTSIYHRRNKRRKHNQLVSNSKTERSIPNTMRISQTPGSFMVMKTLDRSYPETWDFSA